MKKLYFAKARSQEFSYQVSMVARLEKLLKKIDLSKFMEKDEYVAIKTHYGSEGGHRIVRPIFLRKIVDAVKKTGGKPFLTDTYRVEGLDYLDIANMEGINHLSVGCPVLLADGIFGNSLVKVKAGDRLGEIGIAADIYHAPAMIVVTHSKGHIQSGYGGAIKNLSMGAIAAKDTDGKSERGRVHALEMHLKWDAGKCELCGDCIDICDHDALTMETDKIEIDHFMCHKCRRCVEVCKSDAMVLPIHEDEFQMSLAEAARAALSTFQEGKVLYINFITEVMPHCDCHPHSDVPVINDQGILIGDDIVAIDKASLDIIEKSATLPDSKAEGKKPEEGLFKYLTGRNPYLHVEYASKLGLGEMEYELLDIDS
jgi:uncharacterized Fe-S center protein